MNLLKRTKNAVKLGYAKPIWYDTVVHNIPPYDPAVFKNKMNVGKPEKIVFPEDKIRINFHSRFPLEALRPTVFHKDLSELPIDSIEQYCLLAD